MPTTVTAGTAARNPSKSSRRSAPKTFYLVVWWMSQNPYAAIFVNRIAAEAAANVRNGLLVTVCGQGADIAEVVDWYRRDPEGNPMPAEWRDLAGQIRVPWSFKTIGPPEAAEVA